MKAREVIQSPRVSRVASALGVLDSPAALAVVQSLCNQPQAVATVSGLTGLAPDGVRALLAELERAGIVHWWTTDAWQLTQLGAELWTVLEPVIVNDQSLREKVYARAGA